MKAFAVVFDAFVPASQASVLPLSFTENHFMPSVDMKINLTFFETVVHQFLKVFLIEAFYQKLYLLFLEILTLLKREKGGLYNLFLVKNYKEKDIEFLTECFLQKTLQTTITNGLVSGSQ